MMSAEQRPLVEATEVVAETRANGRKKRVATELAVRPPESVAVTPMRLIELAVGQNADFDKLSKLMDLQERWEANEARKAFVQAINAFKAEPPQIVKNKRASFGQGRTAYEYASLDNICEQIVPALSKHGISHRWEIEQVNGRIRVSCILTHALGHSERTSMEGPADTSGSKNAIQAEASSVT